MDRITIFRGVGASTGTPKSMGAMITNVNTYMTFEMPEGTDYIVPAGKTLKITRIIWLASATGMGLLIGYGDNGVGLGATEPTNAVYLTSGDLVRVPVAHTTYAIDLYLEVPAGKYPFLSWATGTGDAFMLMIGVEE